MIQEITQQLQSIGFTSTEVTALLTIIYNAVEQFKDPEQQVANTLNYKYIEGYSLINNSFGGDWYNLTKEQRYKE